MTRARHPRLIPRPISLLPPPSQSEECAQKLDRAQRLIGGLGGEKDRWAEVSAALAEVFNNITGDILIGSGVLSYMGPFTQVW